MSSWPKKKELQSKVCERSDIVITTAQLFGRPAPRIIDNSTIKKMKRGSVVLDMAVESGEMWRGLKGFRDCEGLWSQDCWDIQPCIKSRGHAPMHYQKTLITGY
ncbi:MAG: hypothetical protein Ct9H90mP6_11220 [Gammaproteobacteria bacterium]|nr:MAG: hypothetical protein Ct9H90mP6_11220 [Gammaproteobacteria bacterium]